MSLFRFRNRLLLLLLATTVLYGFALGSTAVHNGASLIGFWLLSVFTAVRRYPDLR